MVINKFSLPEAFLPSAPIPASLTEQQSTVIAETNVTNPETQQTHVCHALTADVTPGAGITKSPDKVTDADFIAAVFHTIPEGASAVICAKFGDPTAGGAWTPIPASKVHGCAANTNNYFNCATFRPDADGTWHARKDKAAWFHCLVLDDVGTKVAREGIGGIKPSWVLETSPGNFQVGFILTNPLTVEADVVRLQNAVIAAGLSDPGAKGMARWMRLPVGINGKDKYKTPGGKRFQCRLTQWNPEVRYTVDELVAGLGLTLEAALPIEPPMPTESVPNHETIVVKKATGSTSMSVLRNMLAAIDPDCSRPEWFAAMAAVHHETRGSSEGFDLFNEWSSKGSKYKGTKDVEVQWNSLKSDAARPYTISKLIEMARDAGADVEAILMDGEDFETIEDEVSQPDTQPQVPATAVRAPGTVSPLTRFSLKDSLLELEKQRVEQRLILGELVLLGQATVIYALANTGKTVIAIHLILEALRKKLIEPSKLFYFNMDDNSTGLVEKVRLFAEYGANMLADGHKGFSAKQFSIAMQNMIETNTASGTVVVLDTLKKFVNTMNKDESQAFAGVVRRFCLKGGTVIALSHANKNLGPDGKIKYTGTTDIVDDFDCAYTLQAIAAQTDASMKVVEFTNIKRRGDVAETAAYSYSTERGLSYAELLTTVQEVDPEQLEPLKHAAEIQSDASVIAAIEACITEGINTKMKMADTGSKRAKVSTRVALKVIEKYTGEDPGLHRWRYVVGARGAQVFEILDRPQAPVVGTGDASKPLDPLAAPEQQAVAYGLGDGNDTAAQATMTPNVIDLESHDIY